MKCDCEKGGHHFHRCTKCGDLTAGYKYEKKWVCYICMGYELTSNGLLKHHIVEWFDSSPLTDETLEGLGFDTKGKLYVNSAILSANYNTNRDIISVSMQTSTGYIKYKTVGGVKLLIEALKGDE